MTRRRYELTDMEWDVICPLLPNKPRGVPRVDDRRVINGILWRFRTGSPWADVPGHGLALAQGGLSRHAIKQVDRMLSNDGIDVDALMAGWAGYCLGSRTEIVVAMDWTDFDADGHSTLMLSLLTEHGRATPLLWLTVRKAELKERRNHYEYWIVTRLAEVLPTEVKVLLVADRGFGDTKLYGVLKDELHFDYVIRFRGNIKVTAAGESRPAKAWIGPSGRARLLREATVTAQGCPNVTINRLEIRRRKLGLGKVNDLAKRLVRFHEAAVQCDQGDADWRMIKGRCEQPGLRQAFGYVVHHGCELPSRWRPRSAQSHLDHKFSAVALERRRFHSLADDGCNALGQEALHPSDVGLMESFGDDQFGKRFAYRLFLCPAKNHFGLSIPADHMAVLVTGHDCLVRFGDDVAHLRFV